MLANILLVVLGTVLTPSGGDDTAAIAGALAADGVAELSAGTFLTSSTVNLNGDKVVFGKGEGVTTISFSGSGDAFQVNSGVGVTTQNARFENFTLDGTDHGVNGIVWGQAITSPLTGTGSMRNVTVKNFSSAGVKLVVTVGIRIDGVTSKQNAYGIHLANLHDAGHVAPHIHGCWLKENGIGLYIQSGVSVDVSDNIFSENELEGVYVLRPDSQTVSTRAMAFTDNHFEQNNIGRSGVNYQFRAETVGNSIIQSLVLARNNFSLSGGTNRHVYFGKGRFREDDNEYLSPIASAATCANTSVCYVAARNDRAPTSYWTLPSGIPPVTWLRQAADANGVPVFEWWKNVGGIPVKQ